MQAHFFAQMLTSIFNSDDDNSDIICIPSDKEMLQEINDYHSELTKEKILKRHYHILGIKQFEYCEVLRKECGLEGFRERLNKNI